jgi:Integrase zinc binding domain
VPQGKLRQALMHGAHDALVSGHLGFNKEYERLRQGVTWPEMYSELKSYVRSCETCQRNTTSNQKPIELLKPLEIPTVQFEQVTMDVITTLPETKANHDEMMVIVDKLTKMVIFIPTRTDMDTLTTAKLFFNHWYMWFGLPKKIVSDRDGRLISKFWSTTSSFVASPDIYTPSPVSPVQPGMSSQCLRFLACRKTRMKILSVHRVDL